MATFIKQDPNAREKGALKEPFDCEVQEPQDRIQTLPRIQMRRGVKQEPGTLLRQVIGSIAALQVVTVIS
jgi:hypothetical protein